MVIGAHYNDNGNGYSGREVYAFTPKVETWMENTKLTASDGASNGEFGRSFSVSVDTLLVGFPGKDNWLVVSYMFILA